VTIALGLTPARFLVSAASMDVTQAFTTLAKGTLTSDNTAPADGETVTIGTTVYTFKTTLSTVPAIQGEVLINTTADAALLNLIRAINHSGTAGVDYTMAAAHPLVSAATSVTSHTFAITSLVAAASASIPTTETSTHLSWGAVTIVSGTLTAGLGISSSVAVYIAATDVLTAGVKVGTAGQVPAGSTSTTGTSAVTLSTRFTTGTVGAAKDLASGSVTFYLALANMTTIDGDNP
jgi:hypothetical protein